MVLVAANINIGHYPRSSKNRSPSSMVNPESVWLSTDTYLECSELISGLSKQHLDSYLE